MDRSVSAFLSSRLASLIARHSIHFATNVLFRTSYSHFWNSPLYTREKPAVIRLTEPLVRKCTKVLAVCKKLMILIIGPSYPRSSCCW
jgi:hypothetical protein